MSAQHKSRPDDTVVKFPIGRVVREHRIGVPLGATPEVEAVERCIASIWKAITTLRRQHATLILQADRLRKQTTPEQHARLVEKNMRRIFARQAEDAAVAEENEGGAA